MPRALAVAAATEFRLRRYPLDELAAAMGVPLRLEARPPDKPLVLMVTERLGEADSARYRAALRVMQVWPCGREAKCLRMSLIAGRLLRHRHPTLNLGVSTLAGRAPAHAWLEFDGHIVDPLVALYRPLTTPTCGL